MKRRLFIAIKIDFDNKTKKFIINLKNELNHEKIKWVEFKNIHLTLKFLGATEEELIPSIKKVLKKVANNFNNFRITTKGLGIFKSFSNPRVLWIGIEKSKYLENIFYEIENNLEFLGFEKNEREFSPHITLGRIKKLNNPKILTKLVLNNCDRVFQDIQVNEIVLMESILKKEGPTYIPLESYSLIKQS